MDITNYQGANITELRLLTNPSDPANSDFFVVFLRTIMDAVLDTQTGRSLAEILAADEGALFGHIANSDIHVNPLWVDSINQIVSELVAFTQQEFITNDERARWNQAAIDAATALLLAGQLVGTVADLQADITQIQNSLFHQIGANPFTVHFADLDGVTLIRGIWNTQAHAIEF